MNYQHITLRFPELSDEAAAALHHFISALMYAVDDEFYKQIHRHYSNRLNNMLADSQLQDEKVEDPPF
jgi:hypothetical protein